jgi:hypothetical protein
MTGSQTTKVAKLQGKVNNIGGLPQIFVAFSG